MALITYLEQERELEVKLAEVEERLTEATWQLTNPAVTADCKDYYERMRRSFEKQKAHLDKELETCRGHIKEHMRFELQIGTYNK